MVAMLASPATAMSGSVGLDVGRQDHLAPLLGLVGDELGEIRGRVGEHGSADIGEPRLEFVIGNAGADGRAQLFAALPSCYLAQLSPNSIESLPHLSFMKIEPVATSIALIHHLAANPPGCRASLVAAMRATDNFYVGHRMSVSATACSILGNKTRGELGDAGPGMGLSHPVLR
jgi:hypothetical protein